MASLKKSLLRKRSVPSENRQVSIKSPESIKSILLVTESENKALKQKVEDLFPSASVYHLYLRDKKIDDTKGFYHSVHTSDFNLTSQLKNDKLKNLESMSLDLLLDLSSGSDLLDYFVKKTDAFLKVGKLSHTNKSSFYDLMVQNESDHFQQIKTISEQLNALTKNGFETV
ncbi:MAG: hypothetical protein WDZ35_07390 [Crocinitomicaceae bacterium]